MRSRGYVWLNFLNCESNLGCSKLNLIVVLATRYHKYDIIQAAIGYLQFSDSSSFGAFHGPEGQRWCNHLYHYSYLSCVFLLYHRRSGACIFGTEISGGESCDTGIHLDLFGRWNIIRPFPVFWCFHMEEISEYLCHFHAQLHRKYQCLCDAGKTGHKAL